MSSAVSIEPQIRLLHAERIRLGHWRHADLRAPYWRMYLQLGEGAEVRLQGQGRWLPLAADRLWLIAPGTAFASRARNHPVQCYVHLQAGLPYDAVVPGIDSRPLGETEVALFAGLPDHPVQRSLDVRQALALHALFAGLLAALPAQRWPPAPADRVIAALLRRLHDDPLGAGDNVRLAAELGVHVNAFIRRFTAAVGVAPQTWLRHRRLELAAARLEAGSDDIETIAESLGFCDRHHFSRAFTRRFAMGPARWRRERRRG